MELTDYKALLDQQMPGPWCWSGRYDDVRLCTNHSGRHYLLSTDRCGLNGSQFTFQLFSGPKRGRMQRGHRDGLYVPRTEYDQKTIVDIDHPLAQLIKRIPEMVTEIHGRRVCATAGLRIVKEAIEALDKPAVTTEARAEAIRNLHILRYMLYHGFPSEAEDTAAVHL